MMPPSRSEIGSVLRRLIAGEISRIAASEWAVPWLINDKRVGDPGTWSALELLGAADLPTTDRPYLYCEEDFLAALEKLSKS